MNCELEDVILPSRDTTLLLGFASGLGRYCAHGYRREYLSKTWPPQPRVGRLPMPCVRCGKLSPCTSQSARSPAATCRRSLTSPQREVACCAPRGAVGRLGVVAMSILVGAPGCA